MMIFDLAFLGAACFAAELKFTPFNASGVYAPGEHVGWTVTPLSDAAKAHQWSFVIKSNNQDVIAEGALDLSSGSARIESSLNASGMIYVEVRLADSKDAHPFTLGAAIAPTQLQPSVPRPADFDAFWKSKIELLDHVPANSSLKAGDSGNDEVEYATIQMDHINGTRVHGQLAKPKRAGKYPAILIFQWAGGPYPLEKIWVTQHAAKGWLAMNIEPHDVLPTEPRSYYAALPAELKNYNQIGMGDRDASYFLAMYLRCYRAVEYLASRDDWDGKTLVVMGTSMGGQQSLCVAGLNAKVTHVIVNEPAGCDLNGAAHGRQVGYPFLPNEPKVLETAAYFDVVNFAPRIKVPALVAMGFTDNIAPPAGIWTAFNQIAGPKEAAPMIDSPHNNLATKEQQRPYESRAAEWLDALLHGKTIEPRAMNAPTTAPTTRASAEFDDYQDMLRQLGVRTVRVGPDPSNPSTFDEANANRFKDSLPDVLKLKNGQRVTSAEMWKQRRAEIVEDFEREVYGRIPANVPKVTWEVTATTNGMSGKIPILTKTLVGHVDNSAYPALSVDIQVSFTVPAGAKQRVPIMMLFTGGRRRPSTTSSTAPATTRVADQNPWTDQGIARGWGYGTINAASIQPDNNKLTTGIIGLTNKGQPRKPDDWGALRAWQWGASRLVDYFEANPESMVDATKVGVVGVSRWGKAAIVTQAFDPRIAVGFIGSSGEGGTKLHRHIFGEIIENLAGGEYYWMAGNIIKYGASDPHMDVGDLPVDSHQLIALCAPRPCFISHGVPERGDAHWIDARGSFMAAVLAGPVYTMLGKQDLGTTGDYLTDPMPPVEQLVGGELAWRQHAGGHEVTPNWPAFFDWVERFIPAPKQ